MTDENPEDKVKYYIGASAAYGDCAQLLERVALDIRSVDESMYELLETMRVNVTVRSANARELALAIGLSGNLVLH